MSNLKSMHPTADPCCLSPLHANAGYPCFISMLYVHASCPCWIPMLHFHALCPCFMPMSPCCLPKLQKRGSPILKVRNCISATFFVPLPQPIRMYAKLRKCRSTDYSCICRPLFGCIVVFLFLFYCFFLLYCFVVLLFVLFCCLCFC
jgi:hypothetical protein